MAQKVYEVGDKKNITATNAELSDVDLMGVFVSQATATPTIKVADAKGTIANTFTPIPGTYYPLPCRTVGTMTVTISGTVDCTIFYAA
jgi:hypothetical protein